MLMLKAVKKNLMIFNVEIEREEEGEYEEEMILQQ
jgi:hypothetical protein